MKSIYFTAILGLFGIICGILTSKVTNSVVNYKIGKCGYEIKNNYFPKIYVYLISAFLALSFAFSIWFYPPVESAFLCMFCYIAVIGTVVDYKMRIIPNELVILLFILGVMRGFLSDYSPNIFNSLLGLILVMSIFALTTLTTNIFKRGFGIGAGDFKLAGVIALIVGYTGSIQFLTGMALMICIYCIGGMYLRLLSLKDTFPMCGFIMSGFIISVFYDNLQPIILWLL